MPSTDQMALRIEPETELKFRGPFTSPVTSILKLSNPTDRRVIFKIKTTAPKRYCVRPNAGVIEPGNNLSVAVVLQPCELESSANRHKFMVQAIYAPAGEINQDELWKTSPSVMESKLRCNFDIPAPEANAQEQQAAPVAEKVIARDVHTENKAAAPSHREEERAGTAGSHSGDERQLKRENKELKEEVERLRRKLKSRIDSGDSIIGTAAANPPSQTMAAIVGAIIVAIICLVMGKFYL